MRSTASSLVANQVAVLTKDNAQGDYSLRNSRASQYVQDNLTAKDRTAGLGVPKDLYGDVIVLSWDTAFETVTDVQERLRSEYFEDVLTQIVSLGREDAFTQILSLGPENLDEGVVRTDGVWDNLGELDDEGDPRGIYDRPTDPSVLDDDLPREPVDPPNQWESERQQAGQDIYDSGEVGNPHIEGPDIEGPGGAR